MFYNVLYIPGGAGFLPSTVVTVAIVIQVASGSSVSSVSLPWSLSSRRLAVVQVLVVGRSASGSDNSGGTGSSSNNDGGFSR